MLIFDRTIAGLIRYRRVYFPNEAQLANVVKNLLPFDLVRVFYPESVVSTPVPPIFLIRRKTSYVDLAKDPTAIHAAMHINCRYKVHRAEKMRDRFEIVMNAQTAQEDFVRLYNAFAIRKGVPRLLHRRRLDEYLPHADIFMLYFEGQPTCGRLVLRDEESGTALMLHSATRRLEQGADTITIGLLNRYLHWHELKTYQAAGMKRYDFGGADDVLPSVARFKLSFGGQPANCDYCAYAGTARMFWKLAHSVNQFRYDRQLYLRRVATLWEPAPRPMQNGNGGLPGTKRIQSAVMESQ